MSQDIGDSRTCECRFGCCSFRGSAGGSFGCSGGLVVAGGVEYQFAEELAGGGVDDADVQVLDEEQDVGSGVGSADADVVQPVWSMRSVRTRSEPPRVQWRLWSAPGSVESGSWILHATVVGWRVSNSIGLSMPSELWRRWRLWKISR
jgi:hypothetical protein